MITPKSLASLVPTILLKMLSESNNHFIVTKADGFILLNHLPPEPLMTFLHSFNDKAPLEKFFLVLSPYLSNHF